MRKKVLAFIIAVIMVFAVCIVGCNEKKDGALGSLKAIPKEDIKVGFIYVGPIGDEGYSYAHNKGRLELEEKLGVKTMYLENVPENSDCEASVRSLIDQGCNVIYATSFGHMDWVANVAKEFPEVYFAHATGFTQLDNMSNYMGRIYEARYLSGIAAGLNTTNGRIGFVAAMPISEVIRGINAFTLGVRAVNPTATVEVKWTNNWYDPALEKSASIELLNTGCDVIAQHSDTTAPQIAAQEKGALAIGYNASTLSVAPDAYLTAPLFHWGAYYCADVQRIIDGTWKSESYWKGIESGIVSLDALSNCKSGTQEKVDEAKAKILDGSFFVFTGEIKDNNGNIKVPAGTKMTDTELTSFDWFVEGVMGYIPIPSK